MSKKRKVTAAAVGAAIAPLLVGIPAGTASAHGYVNSPPSRQAQCAEGTIECGAIKWEPHSVEGPKGLMSCSGGNSRFAELDDESKGWVHTPVGTTVNFDWILTAPHRTSTWEYFIGGTKVATFDQGGQQPPRQLSHTVDLSGYSGEQTVLARWNVADTANAFYACIDLNIGG